MGGVDESLRLRAAAAGGVTIRILLALLAASLPAEVALGRVCIYQGRLADAGTPANGTYDFEFWVFDAARVPWRT